MTVPPRLKPRKMPLQSRSGVTVEAIFEAAIQVLLVDGLARLTTTRVAVRAGVSVGTLYQYFPNKEAMLFAILQQHFEEVTSAFEAIEFKEESAPLVQVAERIADAYVSVKIARPDATRALYRVAGAIDQFRLPADVYLRLEKAVMRLLSYASDAFFSNPQQTAFTLLSALAGLSRGCFGAIGPGDAALDNFRNEARLLARAYTKAVSTASAGEQ